MWKTCYNNIIILYFLRVFVLLTQKGQRELTGRRRNRSASKTHVHQNTSQRSEKALPPLVDFAILLNL